MAELPIAGRMERLGTETAFEVLAKARALEAEGRSVVHLEIGEPDFVTPANVIGAAKQALDDGYTHYGPSAGLPELRAAIAEDVGRTRRISVSPEQVVVTPGAKPIMFFLMLCCLNEGDEVIYPDPGFPTYESVASFIGAKPVPLPLREQNDFRLDIDDLRKRLTQRTRMLILNSPQNPTGSVLTQSDIEQIAALVAGSPIVVLSDEVYRNIIYSGEAPSIASIRAMTDQTVILDGFSKTYAMTGWRLGYGVMAEELSWRIARLMTNSNSCTASFVQMAGVEALRGPQDSVTAMVAEFSERRRLIVDGLNQIPGVSCRSPQGAFYVFPNVSGLPVDSQQIAERLLSEAGVAALSGRSFGVFADDYLRLSYANSIPNIQRALERIDGFCRSLLAGSAVR
jgi:aspartate/methionine/tyrosine aminotransferase